MVEYCDTLETERREQRGTQSRPTHWRRPLYSTADPLYSRHMFEQPPQARQRRRNIHHPHHGPQGGLVGGDHWLMELLLPGGNAAHGGKVPSRHDQDLDLWPVNACKSVGGVVSA